MYNTILKEINLRLKLTLQHVMGHLIVIKTSTYNTSFLYIHNTIKEIKMVRLHSKSSININCNINDNYDIVQIQLNL